jgi:Nucleotidyl transferase AbiEii toxin, Type IV TA system
MIDRREILEAGSSFSLLPSIVEKDYVLGWMLAGINAHEELSESWIFKGGTCLKKCYFETYRFSEDLDFTLRNEDQLDEEFLRGAFEEVIVWVTDQSGLTVPVDQLEFDIYDNSAWPAKLPRQDRLPRASFSNLRWLAQDQTRPDGRREASPSLSTPRGISSLQRPARGRYLGQFLRL